MFSCNLPPALLAEWLGFLHATVVTRGWNRYQNKSQLRKSTLEKKILLLLQQGFEPATFQSQVWRSNSELSPLCGVLLTVQWCLRPALWHVADCSVVFTARFVACCWLFSGVYGLLCGMLLTVQWCLRPALWRVADCSVVFTACFVACCWLFSGVYSLFVVCCWLFSGVYGLLCGVLLTVQWCLRPALWCVADCSVVFTACFVVCCRGRCVLECCGTNKCWPSVWPPDRGVGAVI